MVGGSVRTKKRKGGRRAPRKSSVRMGRDGGRGGRRDRRKRI